MSLCWTAHHVSSIQTLPLWLHMFVITKLIEKMAFPNLHTFVLQSSFYPQELVCFKVIFCLLWKHNAGENKSK